MRKYKIIDVWVSMLLYITFLVICIITLDPLMLLTGYIVIGSWHVISMIVHAYYNWFNQKTSARRTYHWITFISLITMPVGSIFALFFLAPLMALYYTWLCYDEVYIKMQRPMALLK